MIRTIVFGGLYWGPPSLGNYHLGFGVWGLVWVGRVCRVYGVERVCGFFWAAGVIFTK